MTNMTRFREFVQFFTRLIDEFDNEEERVFTDGKALFSELITHDDWLPKYFAKPHPDRYQQYLLYCDPMERFSVASFVWGPGQKTPIHDHTVWGMVGVMRGSELCEEFHLDPATGQLLAGDTHQLTLGGIDLVSPRIGDIHKVSNALSDSSSVSIHIYGANIGAVNRHIYEFPCGHKKTFISEYLG
jgi:predicted metal-dependent enzyme (double-stranded beta helix superfamily)